MRLMFQQAGQALLCLSALVLPCRTQGRLELQI